MKANNFDFLSNYYDFLTKIIFWNTLYQSQKSHLELIHSDDKILILGGGTGDILNHLNALQIPLEIDYVEKSTGMMKKAKAKGDLDYLNVNFITADFLSLDLTADLYDLAITNFFLDVFSESNLQVVISKVNSTVKHAGKWIITDFRENYTLWGRILIKVMYLFFRFTTNLEGNRLMNFEKHLNGQGFSKGKEKFFYHKLISSCIYEKHR